MYDPYATQPTTPASSYSHASYSYQRPSFSKLAAIIGPLLLLCILIAAYILWHSAAGTYNASGQLVVSTPINDGSLANGNTITLKQGDAVSIVITSSRQTDPEDISIPAFNAQTTVAQNSTSNLEFTATMKGSYPVYLTNKNGVRSQIGKVVVQ